MFEEILINQGPLFSNERLAGIVSSPKWECDTEAGRFKLIVQDTLDKVQEMLDEDGTEPQSKYYFVNTLLHGLGFVYSISEPVPLQVETRPKVDYALFSGPEPFVEAEPMRGATNFYRHAIGLCQAAAWKEPLDVSEDPETAAQQPMVLMNLYLGSTGVDYGIVTNGSNWRLLHRGSSDNFTTFVEIDLDSLLARSNTDFKWFYILFNPQSFIRGDEGTCFLDQLLE